MKKTLNTLLILCTVMLTSCNLFIDEDLENQLLEYSGKGYDEVVSETTEDYSVEYKFKKTTLELNADHPLTRHIVRVENIDSARCHIIYFDSSVSLDELPRVGQCIVSNNTELFPYGLCDMVGLVEQINGEHVLTCKGVDVKDAFEHLEFHASIEPNNNIDGYDLYDSEGNVIYHVDNTEANARQQVTRGGDDDDWLKLYLPFNIPLTLPGYGKINQYGGEYLNLSFTGGKEIKLKGNFDFDFDDGLTSSLRIQDKTELGIKVEAKVQIPDTKLWGNDDYFNGRVKWTIGPVVVVPVAGISVHVQIGAGVEGEIKGISFSDCEFIFENGDFRVANRAAESKIETKFGGASNIDFPIIKISFGFGLFSSDLSVRQEVFLKVSTKTPVPSASKTYNITDNKEGEFIIDQSPKLSVDFQMGFAMALVAKGMVIRKIVSKIKDYLKETASFSKAVKKYEKAGTYFNWISYANGEYDKIDKNTLKEMDGALNGLTGDERKNAINEMIKRKSRESSQIQGLSDSWAYTNSTGHVVMPEEGLNNEEIALRLGPYYPERTKWRWYEKYLFPKMKEGSFRMGRSWDANREKLIFTAEYLLEDPGMFAAFTDYYPGFLIKRGNEEILYEMANDGEMLRALTPHGKKFSASFPGLAPDQVYTCVPGYALSSGTKPKIWDKSISFSATTPSISIIDMKVTKNERNEQYDADNNPIGVTYNYAFDTYTEVKGSRNVSEWGLIDLNDTNEKTRVHTSKTASLKSGRYIHHWSIKNTKKSRVAISLQPYLFAKVDGNKRDWSEAKFFPRYDAIIKDEFDFSESRPWKNYGADGNNNDYKVELDSITVAY